VFELPGRNRRVHSSIMTDPPTKPPRCVFRETPWHPNGANADTLRRRVRYGGRKARRAAVRLLAWESREAAFWKWRSNFAKALKGYEVPDEMFKLLTELGS
jgi:hypothetical protein